tara:strand:- start:53 stop:571 length:519 start_codon:yes stop_codon:yes gene_type:complete
MCDMGFVYKWSDSSNEMYYIGSHKGTPNDRYIGSGIHFNRAYSKRPEAFSREIMYNGVDYRELEEFVLEELNAMNDSMSYNLKNSAMGGHMGAEGIEKMRKAITGKKRSLTARENISNGKVRYRVYCSINNKTYKSAMEAASDLGITPSYVRGILNGHFKNKYELSRIEKIK